MLTDAGATGPTGTRREDGFSQGLAPHLTLLASLLLGLWAAGELPGFWEGELWGLSTRVWLYLAVANAVVHQLYVFVCWRAELYGQRLTRRLGEAAFPAYAVIFAVLILARPLLVTGLAISNAGTLPISAAAGWTLAVLTVVPALYLGYSVKRYFGFERAFGIDHFDPAYRSAPLVREGIFRFSSNAMYVYGFLLLWAPALGFRSVTACVAALFSHLYIWVHYYFTEKPDMEHIYG